MKLSLDQRLAALSPVPAASSLRWETVACVFQGVALLTHLAYPEQRLEQIKESCQISGQCPYGQLLTLSHPDLRSADSWHGEREELAAHLLIEPFAAIHEAFKEEDTHDPV